MTKVLMILMSMILWASGYHDLTAGESVSTSRAAKVEWRAGQVISEQDVARLGLDSCFTMSPIGDGLFRRMQDGGTWKPNTPASLRGQLRYLRMLHRNADGRPQMGEMVVNERIAARVLRIFRQLYEADYRIERMVLMDEYQADDETAMRHNNTSSFNFRFMANSTTRISKHGAGLAIDINPLYNPFVLVLGMSNAQLRRLDYGHRKRGVTYDFEPATGEPYAFERSKRTDIPMKIDRTDLAYKLFTAEGFAWGGDWSTRKDYQHFEVK